MQDRAAGRPHEVGQGGSGPCRVDLAADPIAAISPIAWSQEISSQLIADPFHGVEHAIPDCAGWRPNACALDAGVAAC